MEQLKNLIVNSTLLRLEKDVAWVERMWREERDRVEKIVKTEKLMKEVDFVRKIKPEDLITEGWEPDNDIRVRLNIFYLYFWMIKEAVRE